MSEPSPAQRLRQIAEEMRLAPASCRKWYGGGANFEFEHRLAATGGALLVRAVAADGFAGPEYGTFRCFIEQEKESHPEHWHESVFVMALVHLLPQQGVNAEEGVVPLEVAFEAVARLIEGEAGEREAGGGDSGPAKKKRKQKRKRDPKAVARRAERDNRHKQERKIFDEWVSQTWDSYEDYARWKNEHLPDGWKRLNKRDVALAIENHKARLKRKRKWPPGEPST